MANKFTETNFKDQKYHDKNPKATVGRLVISVFEKNRAFTEATAIPIEKFKDLDLSNESIGYTIGNYYESNLIKKTDDGRFYFLKDEYKKFESKIFRKTYFILAVPIIFLIIFTVIANGGFTFFK